MILKKQFLRHLQVQHAQRKSNAKSPRNAQFSKTKNLPISIPTSSQQIQDILCYIKKLFETGEETQLVEDEVFSLLKKIEYITIKSQSKSIPSSELRSVDIVRPINCMYTQDSFPNSLPTIMNNLAFIYHKKNRFHASYLYSQKAVEHDGILEKTSSRFDFIKASPRQTAIQSKKSIGQIISILNLVYTTLSQQPLSAHQFDTAFQSISTDLRSSIQSIKYLKKSHTQFLYNTSNRLLFTFPLLRLSTNLSQANTYIIEKISSPNTIRNPISIELEALSFYYLGLIESLVSKSLSTQPFRRSLEVIYPLSNTCNSHKQFFNELVLLLGNSYETISHSSNSNSVSSTPRNNSLSKSGEPTTNRLELPVKVQRPQWTRERTASNPEKQYRNSSDSIQLQTQNLLPLELRQLYSTEIMHAKNQQQRTSLISQKKQIYSPRGDNPHQIFKSQITSSCVPQNMATQINMVDQSTSEDNKQVKRNLKTRRVLRVSFEALQMSSVVNKSKGKPKNRYSYQNDVSTQALQNSTNRSQTPTQALGITSEIVTSKGPFEKILKEITGSQKINKQCSTPSNELPKNQIKLPGASPLNSFNIPFASSTSTNNEKSQTSLTPLYSAQQSDSFDSSFQQHCKRHSLLSARKNHSEKNEKYRSAERSILDSLSIFDTANSVTSQIIPSNNKSKNLNSSCHRQTSHNNPDAAQSKSIDSVDRIYGSKTLLNSFRNQSTQASHQNRLTNSQDTIGYDQSLRVHRCMDDEVQMQFNRSKKKGTSKTRYFTNDPKNTKCSEQAQQSSINQINGDHVVVKPQFIDSFLSNYNNDFIQSLAKRINSKLNFLNSSIREQLSQESELYDALLSNEGSSAESIDSQLDQSFQ